MPVLPAGVSGALEVRRSTVEQVDVSAGGIYTSRQQFDVFYTGETSFPCFFPVQFTEMPAVLSGWSMWPNQHLPFGNFPIVQCGVFQWHQTKRVDNGFPVYTGAVMALLVQGDPLLQITLHLMFVGKAVRNPGS